MIVADTSAFMAIGLGEPEAYQFTKSMSENDVLIPASVLVETGILATFRGVGKDLETILRSVGGEIISLDEEIAGMAVEAYQKYGKGRHKANLNFGDCLVYATAKYLNAPLLFKGDDFIHTPVKRVLS